MKYAYYKIITVSSQERKLFFEALFVSFNVRMMLLVLPFKQYSHKLGERGRISKNIEEKDSGMVYEVVHAIKRAVKYSFWRNKCLEQAITAKKMLGKRNISSTVFFGVRKPGDKLEAHAWLKAGDTFIVGERNHEKFTVVAYFS